MNNWNKYPVPLQRRDYYVCQDFILLSSDFVLPTTYLVLLNIPFHPYQVHHENEQLLLS